jgi:hypothetical protein
VTTPNYFVSVQSGHGHSRLIGGDSIYRATSTGFRIYVLHELGPITPEAAEKHEWTVGWLADQSEWGGASEPGLWREHDVKVCVHDLIAQGLYLIELLHCRLEQPTTLCLGQISTSVKMDTDFSTYLS